jgi:hypothetical protein
MGHFDSQKVALRNVLAEEMQGSHELSIESVKVSAF